VSLPVGLAVRHPDLRAVPGIPAVWSVAGPQPESVRLVPCVRVIGHTRRALEAIARAGFDPRNVAVVDRPVGLPPDTVADSREWAGVATWSSRSSGGTAWVEAAHGPCLMVVPVTAMPGWHVRLDGRTVSPVRANAAHLGVVIPPGRHTVRLSYEPVSVRLGLFCSMLGTFVMCMGSTYAASVARRRRRVKVN
ncbi:MAG: YfhO family protein, partial [Armatimonadetes bacterium]|nr:YfhO family protein [Armatimonadota bacterium]